jgi:site-specific DNA-methyltransferase (adenine-specific)/adenine-specific DNA-methyltransferase
MQILTDDDREKIIRLLQAGKPLPEIYKSRLFPAEDKEYIELTKVYQLVYQGKKRKEDIIAETLEAPLQEVRTFNSENSFPDSWRNMLIFGDNLLALKTLYEDPRGPNKYNDIPQRYWFKFLTPSDYDDFFQAIETGSYRKWRSELMNTIG